MLTMGYEASFFSSPPFTVRRLSAFSLTYQGMLRERLQSWAFISFRNASLGRPSFSDENAENLICEESENAIWNVRIYCFI